MIANLQRPLAFGILVLVIVYLTGFVGKGWLPHDEGMIGQLAEHAAAGRVPHLDFEDPYTGGLSWLSRADLRYRSTILDLQGISSSLSLGAKVAVLVERS